MKTIVEKLNNLEYLTDKQYTWLKETDVELLSITQKMLKDREIQVSGIKPVIGFYQPPTTDNEIT